MVNLFKRMRKLNTLLNIRLGPGAATLPSLAYPIEDFPPVTRIHLTYAYKIYNGHRGARHFWRNCLPRLKYHNPGVQMTVKQTDEQDEPAAITIYFAERPNDIATSNAANIADKYAPTPSSSEKAVVIDAKGIDYREIWERVQAVTGAREVEATPKEVAELEKLEKMRIRAEVDRARIVGIRQAKKAQERVLQEAKGEVEKLRLL